MDVPLMRTPLYDWHVSHGGRMVDFAGWAMPVQYTSIIEEHRTIRSAVGMADISHMGRLRFEGPGAAVFLAELLTRRVADMELGQIRYSLVTNDEGGILDDVLVGYYHNSHGQPFFLVVVNASNRAKIVDWVHAHLPQERAERPGHEVIWADVSRLWAMFAIQGPRSVELLQPLVDVDLKSMRYYRGAQAGILHPAAQRQGGIISRTGYTGEDGFELSLGASIAPGVWEVLMELGRPLGVVPAGLGARDTLRLEAGMPLYGHELSEADQSVPGRLGLRLPPGGLRFSRPRRPAADPEASRSSRFASGWNFRASGPPAKAARSWPTASRSARSPAEPIRPRSTSRSPWATSRPEFARPGTELQIDIRGRIEPARVVELPFYQSQQERTAEIMSQDLLYSKTHEWARVETGSGGGEDRHRGADRLRPGSAHRPGAHRIARGRPPGEGRPAVRRDRIGQGRQRSLQPGRRRSGGGQRGRGRQPRTPGRRSLQAGWFIKIKISDEAGLAELLDDSGLQETV